MIDLSDLTFIIPIRIDSMDRFLNLKCVLNFFYTNFKTNLIISEDDATQKFNFNPPHNSSIAYEYQFLKNESGIFHRTKILNSMIRQAKTPYIANYDCDVLLPLPIYQEAYNLLVDFGFVYPYSGLFLDVPPSFKDKLISGAISVQDIPVGECRSVSTDSVGGAIFVRRDTYIASGMENEHFQSWGLEDLERFARWHKLGFKIARLDNPLYHLAHPRPPNSNFSNPYYEANKREYERVSRMDTHELRAYIHTWPWGLASDQEQSFPPSLFRSYTL